MAKSKLRSRVDASLVLQIALVLFLITLAIVDLTQYNSNLSQFGRSFNRFVGRADNPVNLVVAIAELAAGILIGLALFVRLERRIIWISCLVIGILWILRILWVFAFYHAFEPSFIAWLNGLSADIIVLVGLWLTGRRYAA